MTAAQRAAIHGVDESVTIDSLERGERFHRALITSLPDEAGSGTGSGVRIGSSDPLG